MEGMVDESQNTNPRELEKILGKHSNIFQVPPHGLPLPPSRDHIIELIPGSTPIRIKSYKLKQIRD